MVFSVNKFHIDKRAPRRYTRGKMSNVCILFLTRYLESRRYKPLFVHLHLLLLLSVPLPVYRSQEVLPGTRFNQYRDKVEPFRLKGTVSVISSDFM